MHHELDREQSDAIADRVREALARRRVSRQHLAHLAKISLSTLEKALAGRRPFTLATVVRLEEALGQELRKSGEVAAPPAGPSALAPSELGAYSRPAVKWLEADYLTLRPSFDDPGAVYAYRTIIEWDGPRGHLVFHEAGRIDSDFTQSGSVSFPHLSGHIYLITSEAGQYRILILGRPAIGGGEMYGILSTLLVGRGSQLVPTAAPIALVPQRGDIAPELGMIRPGGPSYETYRRHIDRVTAAGFARFAV